MSTGVKASDDCLTAYNELKLKKQGRYVEFKMSDDKKHIVVGSIGDRGTTWADFHATLPADDCRYYLFDFEYVTADGPRSKLIFLNWAPESCAVRQKMLYAASKDAIRKKIEGVIEVQANDLEDASEATVQAKAIAGR